jgi:hypothetical protein
MSAVATLHRWASFFRFFFWQLYMLSTTIPYRTSAGGTVLDLSKQKHDPLNGTKKCIIGYLRPLYI